MTYRSTLGVVGSSAILVMSACIAESGKTDTVVVQQEQPAKQARSTPSPAPAAAEPRTDTVIPAPGTINIRNPNFANVNVEVRVGPSADCAQNAVFGARQLQRGATWTIQANQDVCWRRDANPDAPNGQWTSWNRQAITPGSTHDATL